MCVLKLFISFHSVFFPCSHSLFRKNSGFPFPSLWLLLAVVLGCTSLGSSVSPVTRGWVPRCDQVQAWLSAAAPSRVVGCSFSRRHVTSVGLCPVRGRPPRSLDAFSPEPLSKLLNLSSLQSLARRLVQREMSPPPLFINFYPSYLGPRWWSSDSCSWALLEAFLLA